MRRRRLLLVLVLPLAAVSCRPAPQAPAPAAILGPTWALDPKSPGPDLPPSGQSTFDRLVPDPVPFPFPKLLEEIARRLGGQVQYQRVLIPMSRSLQRVTASPNFFEYPRAVAAFDTQPDANTVLVQDRLFLGYHEKGQLIEVLSYNEQAGRFEFQLVKNYRAGATPSVSYARRAVCAVCHQNQSPLFPRQLWDETNANYLVARMLASSGKEFYGFPVQLSADTPYRIDLAVHRANEFSIAQLLWSKADVPTRAAWLTEMLRCRMAGACDFPTITASLAEQWRQWWPRGLALPNPEIANRSPLAIFTRDRPAEGAPMLEFLAASQKNIDARFEPATPRQPLEVWMGEPEHVRRVAMDLAAFLPEADIRAIARAAHTPEAAGHAVERIAASGALSAGTFHPSAIREALFASLGSAQEPVCCPVAPAEMRKPVLGPE